MRMLFFFFLTLVSCSHTDKDTTCPVMHNTATAIQAKEYESVLHSITVKQKKFSGQRNRSETDTISSQWVDFWIETIGTDLYEAWKGTAWDFNGHTSKPHQGSIACGYFVTTILSDMGMSINRIKLSTYPSMQMMKAICPDQKIQNLSNLGMEEFDARLTGIGKSVYIIGLDFHTGIIVSDETGNWFIHSNYIKRQGVIKEAVLASAALRASRTRWIVSLTSSKTAMNNWLR